MNYYTNCPECTTTLDLDEAIKNEGDQPYFDDGMSVFSIGDEFSVEVNCPKCKVTVTVDCEVTFEFSPNIY